VQLTRRAALGIGVGAVVLAGCNDKKPTATPPPTAAPVPDASALATARHDEVALLAAYDDLIKHTAVAKRGPLQVERAIHATHLSALKGIEGGAQAHHHDNIEHALRASAQRLRRLSLAATLGANAALFASIAASHTASAA
jgi:hypothetical protein